MIEAVEARIHRATEYLGVSLVGTLSNGTALYFVRGFFPEESYLRVENTRLAETSPEVQVEALKLVEEKMRRANVA